MSRPCTVCSHAEHPAIDQALVAGESYRTIAHTHGLSTASLVRHRQHGASSSVTDTVTVTAQSPQPCSCPCTRFDWHGLAHDAQQFNEYIQQAQTQDEALRYMRFYLMRFAALIASAGAMREV